VLPQLEQQLVLYLVVRAGGILCCSGAAAGAIAGRGTSEAVNKTVEVVDAVETVAENVNKPEKI